MFKFRLDALMRHRKFKLGEAQAALADAVSFRMQIESEIEQLAESRRHRSEQLEKEQENGIEAARYLSFKEHLSVLERELLQLLRKLNKASREVERRKKIVIECDKAVKTLESIETKDRELYRLMESRKEQKKLDDAAVLRVRSSKH